MSAYHRDSSARAKRLVDSSAPNLIRCLRARYALRARLYSSRAARATPWPRARRALVRVRRFHLTRCLRTLRARLLSASQPWPGRGVQRALVKVIKRLVALHCTLIVTAVRAARDSKSFTGLRGSFLRFSLFSI